MAAALDVAAMSSNMRCVSHDWARVGRTTLVEISPKLRTSTGKLFAVRYSMGAKRLNIPTSRSPMMMEAALHLATTLAFSMFVRAPAAAATGLVAAGLAPREGPGRAIALAYR